MCVCVVGRQKSASGARLPAATAGGRCGGGGGGGKRFRFWVSLNRVAVQHQQNQGGLCGGGAGGGVPSADTRHSWWSSMRCALLPDDFTLLSLCLLDYHHTCTHTHTLLPFKHCSGILNKYRTLRHGQIKVGIEREKETNE